MLLPITRPSKEGEISTILSKLPPRLEAPIRSTTRNTMDNRHPVLLRYTSGKTTIFQRLAPGFRESREQEDLDWMFSTVADHVPDETTYGITHPGSPNVERIVYVHTPQGDEIRLSTITPRGDVNPVAVNISGSAIVPGGELAMITTDQAGKYSLTFSVNHSLCIFKPGDRVYSRTRLGRGPSARKVRKALERSLSPNTKSKTIITA